MIDTYSFVLGFLSFPTSLLLGGLLGWYIDKLMDEDLHHK